MLTEMHLGSIGQRVSLASVLGDCARLSDADGDVIVVEHALMTRIRAWMWPYGTAAAAAYIAGVVALLVRASFRDRLWFTAPATVVATCVGILYIWRFYRRLPSVVSLCCSA